MVATIFVSGSTFFVVGTVVERLLKEMREIARNMCIAGTLSVVYTADGIEETNDGCIYDVN